MIYLFDRAKKLQKIIPRKHIINATQTKVRNGIYQLAVEVPIFYETKQGTHYNYQKSVSKAEFAGHYDDKNRFQLYKIYSRNITANEQGEFLLFDGVHIFFDEAKAMGNIHDRRFRDSEAKAPADAVFNSIGWTIIDYDVTDRHDINFYRASVTDAWNDLISTYGVEFDYELQFDGRKIISKNIIMKKQIGQWTGQRFAYGTNVLTLTQEQDESEVYTAAVGRGRGEEAGDGFGPRLEFGDIAWSKDGITKPVGQNYIELPSATAEYGFIENGIVKPRIAPEVVFEDIEDKKKLAEATYYWLLENCLPKATWKTEVARIGALNLGDTVGVLYKAAGIIKRARVEKIEYNLLDPELSKLTLGDFHHFENRQMKRINAQIKRLGRDSNDRITRIKNEWNAWIDNQFTAALNQFEQNLIDQKAEIEAYRVNMTNLIEGTRAEFTDNINAEITQTKEYAEEQSQAKADKVRTDLETVTSGHKALIDGLKDNVLDIDTFLGDKSKILKQQFDKVRTDFGTLQTDLDGVESDLTATKTDLQKQLDEARADMDGLEVGGRNYILNSENGIWLWSNSSAKQPYNNTEFDEYHLYKTLEPSTGISSYSNAWVNHAVGTKHMDSVEVFSTIDTYAALNHSDLNNKRFFIPANTWTKIFTERVMTSDRERVRGISTDRPIPDGLKYRKYMNHLGHIPMDWTPAPEDIDAKITKVSSDLEVEAGRIEGLVTDISKDYVKQSSVKVTSDRVTIGSTVVNGSTIGSVLSVSPTGIDAVADAMRLSGDLLVAGDVTALAVTAIEGNFSRLFASSLTTNVIKSNHVQTDTAFAKKLFATNANIDELVTRTHFSNSIKTLSIDAVHADLSSVNSEIMTTNILKSDWIDVDNAIVNRIISRQFFTENATIKAANIRDLTAIDIKGGILSALNGNYTQNLTNGITDYYGNALIHFHDENNRLRMTHQGHIMEIGTKRGATSPIFYMGGHRNLSGQVEPGDYGFTGLKTVSDLNRAEVIGDRVYISEGGQQNAMAVSFDYSTAISNRTAFIMPVRRDSSDSYYIGNLNTWFDGVFTHRLSGLDIYRDPSTHNVDIGRALSSYPTNAPRLNFRPDDIWYKDVGGTVSIKERLSYAKSAYDRVFVGGNSVDEQIKSLAARIYALEHK